MKRLLGVLPVFAAACGSLSDVVALDSATYMVASHGVVGNGSAAAEKAKAVQAAATFCERKGSAINVVSAETVDPFFGRAPSAEVRFRCEDRRPASK